MTITPADILEQAYRQAEASLDTAFVADATIGERVEYVCRNVQNRSGSRLLLACLLAKLHQPQVDVRKPYTEIGGIDTFSGRTYDEAYVTAFVSRYQLPCNPTTAFLTPAFRNRNTTLTPDLNLVGRPPKLYQTLLCLLDDVHTQRVAAADLLAEVIRWLTRVRNENQQRIATLLAGLQSSAGGIPLSVETIVGLIAQHLRLPLASRLPVLVIAAAYEVAAAHLGERLLPLQAHNAADEQTGALGDVEIVLEADNRLVTSYEMKLRRVTREDLDRAVQKIARLGTRIDNYIFITTEAVDPTVEEYAASLYVTTQGIEVAVLDCIGFVRHFLHLFHRLRMQFLEMYQRLVLAEPERAVGYPLKEAFLALRQAAESGLNATESET
ncbi:MAG: DNA methyltransferase [Chloroflexaceae bacterium]|jgi:DNA adenine methylase|nr:DNA methyltransferase [Chloroflexaceae bacterium]